MAGVHHALLPLRCVWNDTFCDLFVSYAPNRLLRRLIGSCLLDLLDISLTFWKVLWCPHLSKVCERMLTCPVHTFVWPSSSGALGGLHGVGADCTNFVGFFYDIFWNLKDGRSYCACFIYGEFLEYIHFFRIEPHFGNTPGSELPIREETLGSPSAGWVTAGHIPSHVSFNQVYHQTYRGWCLTSQFLHGT